MEKIKVQRRTQEKGNQTGPLKPQSWKCFKTEVPDRVSLSRVVDCKSVRSGTGGSQSYTEVVVLEAVKTAIEELAVSGWEAVSLKRD